VVAALTAAIVLVGLLCLVDLLLTVGVVRRLREHEVKMVAVTSSLSGPGPSWLPVGSRPPAFTSATVAGEVLSDHALADGRAIVAFLQSGCRPCEERLPAFRALMEGKRGAGTRAIAVVVGSPPSSAPLMASLRDIAPVVGGKEAEHLARTFAVNAFPTFYALEDGLVTAVGTDVGQVADTAPTDQGD
jgi:hypothetical protein